MPPTTATFVRRPRDATPAPNARAALLRHLDGFRAIGPAGESRRHRLARLALSAALAELDLAALDRLQRDCERELEDGREDSRRWLGYLDLGAYLVRAAGLAVKLDLDRRPPSRILDLGCGGGQFAFLCRAALGHEVVGLELPAAERSVNHALCRLLGVPVVEARLGPRLPLPDGLPGRFDLATALSPQFHRIDVRRFWSPDDWAWFLGELERRATGPEGAFYLKINREKRVKGGLYRHDDFLAFARARGAAVEEATGIVRFERLGG